MTRDEDRDEPIVIRLLTSDLELPLDMSRGIRELAARRGTTPESLITQAVVDELQKLGYDSDPASEQAVEAADRNDDQAQNL